MKSSFNFKDEKVRVIAAISSRWKEMENFMNRLFGEDGWDSESDRYSIKVFPSGNPTREQVEEMKEFARGVNGVDIKDNYGIIPYFIFTSDHFLK